MGRRIAPRNMSGKIDNVICRRMQARYSSMIDYLICTAAQPPLSFASPRRLVKRTLVYREIESEFKEIAHGHASRWSSFLLSDLRKSPPNSDI